MKFKDVEVVFWDIYGTILKTPAGEMSDLLARKSDLLKAFLMTARRFGLGNDSDKLYDLYRSFIEKEHTRKAKIGISYPEIDITDVWRGILKKFSIDPDEDLIKDIASYFYEVSSKPKVYPGVYSTLKELIQRYKQGIISNSQFYTIPNLLNQLRNQGQVESVRDLFDEDLIILSYKLGYAKPNPKIFTLAVKKTGYNIKQTVYVGNDMYNDVYVPKSLGFKTILYAGDPETVRWRRNISQCQKLLPDATIKSIPQILNLLL